MVSQPDKSIPNQSGDWAATQGCYRFLNNNRVLPEAIIKPVCELTKQACENQPVVLCIHDLTKLTSIYEISPTQLLQHTILAVSGDKRGQILGVMNQRWFNDIKTPKGETRSQRRSRWTRSNIWSEATKEIGAAPKGSRWIMVADREADDFQVYDACDKRGQGWVIRSQHNRFVQNKKCDASPRLRETVESQLIAGKIKIKVPRRSASNGAFPSTRYPAKSSRTAKLHVRYCKVMIEPPRNDPRYHGRQARLMYAVSLKEYDVPAGVDEPINWLLLTSEPVDCFDDAMQIIQWYRKRWLIEEFHKAQKTGCRLEKTQLQTGEALCRLAAIAAAVAVRLLHLRELADDLELSEELAIEHVDVLWVAMVAALSKKKIDPETMTVKMFYHTIAKHGGWLGRKGDGRPGWQTLYRGWQRIADYITGIKLFQQLQAES